jgi:hypothetical protein
MARPLTTRQLREAEIILTHATRIQQLFWDVLDDLEECIGNPVDATVDMSAFSGAEEFVRFTRQNRLLSFAGSRIKTRRTKSKDNTQHGHP